MPERDKSPKRGKQPRSYCSLCHLYCEQMQKYEKYVSADTTLVKWICCNCFKAPLVQFDDYRYTKSSCSTCSKRSRSCVECKMTHCEFLNTPQNLRDNSGFYCCDHRDFSEFWNKDTEFNDLCDACAVPKECPASDDCFLIDEGDVPAAGSACKSCSQFNAKRGTCDCCDSEVCVLCHDHWKSSDGPPEMDIVCTRCHDECDPENGDLWHKSEEPSPENSAVEQEQ